MFGRYGPPAPGLPLTTLKVQFLAPLCVLLLFFFIGTAVAGDWGKVKEAASAAEPSRLRQDEGPYPPAQPLSSVVSTSPAFLNQVQEIFIAYYQRPADPAGLGWWSQQLAAAGGNLNDIIDAFANSRESSDLYGEITPQNIREVINSIYQALFNRDADQAGLDFYANGFNQGDFTPGTIVLNILDGAQNEDAVAIAHKLYASKLLTRNISPSLGGAAFSRPLNATNPAALDQGLILANEGEGLRATNYQGPTAEIEGRAFLTSVTADFQSFPRSDSISQYVRDFFAVEGDPILTDEAIPATITVLDTNTGAQVLSTAGTEVDLRRGAISALPDQSAGSVSVSIEAIAEADLPGNLPLNYGSTGDGYLIGPSGFIFTEPVRIWLPAEQADSPVDLVILWFDDAREEWVPLITSDIDPAQRRLAAAVFELGYFRVARSALLAGDPLTMGDGWAAGPGAQSGPLGANGDDRHVGGIRLTHRSTLEDQLTRGYQYALCVGGVDYTYPEVPWPDLVGYNVSTGSTVSTNRPLEQTWMSNIPQGQYRIIVSRQRPGDYWNPPGDWEILTDPLTVDVGAYTRVAGGWNYSYELFEGWTEIQDIALRALSSGAVWQSTNDPFWLPTDPATLECNWPEPTVPYGTGDVNITLEWVNTDQLHADLDLHLYGPDGLHLYYSNKSQGALELDRDWLNAVGNATENIYTTGVPAPGEYRVEVDHFSGDLPISGTVRIKVGDSVRTYRLTFDDGNQQEVETFTLN